MIKQGDIVRWKNEALAQHNALSVKSKRSTGKRYRSPRRGENELHRVVSVQVDRWNWRTKRHNRIVELDDGSHVTTDWLSFVRRPKAAVRASWALWPVQQKLDGTNYFVEGRQVGREEYLSVRQRQQKQVRRSRRSMSGFGSPSMAPGRLGP